MKGYYVLFSLTVILVAILAACSNATTISPQVSATSVSLTPMPLSESTPTATPRTVSLPTVPPPTSQTRDVPELEYYWPSLLPQDLGIDPCSLRVDDTGFNLTAGTGGVSLRVAGGAEVHWVPYLPPCNNKYQDITVRGQRGCVSVDNSGHYTRVRVFWQRGGTIYAALGSGLQLEDILETVEHLEVVGRDVFRQRIEPLITPTITPSGPLVYYWPSELPKELIIDARESSADETGFVLSLMSPGNEWSAVLRGGSKADLNEFCDDLYEPGIVRGQQGFINMGTGAGFGVAWRENENPYTIGGPGMYLAEVQELADTLEPVTLTEWIRRLEQSQ